MSAPIDDQDFFLGVKVVDIADIRVSRGFSRRPASVCPHRRIAYDARERRVWCRDCEEDVEAFDAFVLLVEHFDRASKALDARAERVSEAEGFLARSLAARELDKAWMKRNTVPACPHCRQGLFPEDFKHGPAVIGREFALARRKQSS